jgi:hypothetical protein
MGNESQATLPYTVYRVTPEYPGSDSNKMKQVCECANVAGGITFIQAELIAISQLYPKKGELYEFQLIEREHTGMLVSILKTKFFW